MRKPTRTVTVSAAFATVASYSRGCSAVHGSHLADVERRHVGRGSAQTCSMPSSGTRRVTGNAAGPAVTSGSIRPRPSS